MIPGIQVNGIWALFEEIIKTIINTGFMLPKSIPSLSFTFFVPCGTGEFFGELTGLRLVTPEAGRELVAHPFPSIS